MLSAKRIMGTNTVARMIIFNIVPDPLSGSLGLNRPCREGFKQTDYKSRVVLMQGGVFWLAKFKSADYTCAGGFAHWKQKN